MTYAERTTVSANRTLAEIQDYLERRGCTDFAFVRTAERASIAFALHGRRVRFNMPLPDKEAFARTPNTRRRRSENSLQEAYEQAMRQRWRALLLTIKAKLASVESGIETFDEAFMGQLLIANGQTMAEWAAPQVELLYSSGEMPPLLASGN